MAVLSTAEWQVVALSLRIAAVGVLLALPVALALGYALSRARFPGKALLEALLTLPLVLPPVVTGYALLVLFGPHGALGTPLERLGLGVAFRCRGAALAAAVMALPLLVLSLRAAFDGVDRRLEAAAATLGAGPWRRFWRVTLPLSRRGVMAGLTLAFARAFGEFGATISFVGNIPGETRTLSIALWELLNQPGSDAAVGRLVMLSLALALLATLGVGLLRREDRSREDQRDA